MKSFIIASIVCVATLASAQVNLADLPPCAQGCLNPSDIGSLGCKSSLDFACICKNKSFIDGLACCVSKKCQQADIDKTIKFASGLCAAASVTLPTSATCPSTAASASTSASSKGSAASATTSGTSMSGAKASATSATGAAGAAVSSATSAAASAVSSSAAAANIASGFGSAGGLAAAIIALL